MIVSIKPAHFSRKLVIGMIACQASVVQEIGVAWLGKSSMAGAVRWVFGTDSKKRSNGQTGHSTRTEAGRRIGRRFEGFRQ